jgi:hypothetical protein
MDLVLYTPFTIFGKDEQNIYRNKDPAKPVTRGKRVLLIETPRNNRMKLIRFTGGTAGFRCNSG